MAYNYLLTNCDVPPTMSSEGGQNTFKSIVVCYLEGYMPAGAEKKYATY